MKKKISALLLAGSMLLSALTGCGTTEETAQVADDMSKEVHLKWVIAHDNVPADHDKVMEEVNKYLKEKINATLEIEFIQSGDFASKANMMLAAQEEGWDLMFTSSWQNPYETNVMLGGYYDISKLLKSETPELYEYFPESYWEALTLNEGIYAVPMNQVMYQQQGLWFHKELAEKYDLVDEIEAAQSQDELTPVYETISENESGVQPLLFFQVEQFDDTLPTLVEGGFVIENGVVTDRLDEGRLQEYKIARDWYEKGIIPQDVNFDATTYLKLGKVFSRYSRQLPGAEAKQKLTYDWGIINKATTDMKLRRADVQGALTAINRVSKNPIRALKLLELMTTDQYLFNLMAYGIEGEHYNFDENGRMVQTENSYYIPEFRIGNQFLAYLMPGHEEDVWEETDRLNREAPADENMGFVFDRTPVETEIANLNSATEYADALGKGTAADVEGTYQKHIEKRKIAGDQIVKEEIERQYAEWKATQE